MTTKTISLTITGMFEDHELAALAALIRTIDGHHTDRHFSIVINDPDSSLGEAEAALRGIMPEVPGRETKFSVHRKQ